MNKQGIEMNKRKAIKVYHGFGHTHDMMVFGHVFKKNIPAQKTYSDNPFRNLARLLRLFLVKPLAGVPVRVKWEDQEIAVTTESDGFFRAEWTATKGTTAGWHDVDVQVTGDSGLIGGAGKIFIPHRTQFAFISDIDDTVLVSHSSTTGKRLKELLFKNPHSRSIFPGVAEHYELLAGAHTTPEAPNPFFYVSSSEWNLYDYLRDVFTYRQLPDGAFLLNQVKRWHQLWKTGKTKHSGKLLRILRVLEIFPHQRFVLMGDNSQSDPEIYSKLAERFADRIFAVYIRNINTRHEPVTRELLTSMEARGIHTFLFTESSAAIGHSRAIGLI